MNERGIFGWHFLCCSYRYLLSRWAGGRDDKYFARIGKNVVSVYETETFTLIDKKSIKVENVMDFSWSPTDPILALFVPELGNQPAKVISFFFMSFLRALLHLLDEEKKLMELQAHGRLPEFFLLVIADRLIFLFITGESVSDSKQRGD